MKYPNAAELLQIIAKTQFKPFDRDDWYAFAGYESENPLIGYYEEFTIVIDGDQINVIHAQDQFGGELYNLIAFIWPYNRRYLNEVVKSSNERRRRY